MHRHRILLTICTLLAGATAVLAQKPARPVPPAPPLPPDFNFDFNFDLDDVRERIKEIRPQLDELEYFKEETRAQAEAAELAREKMNGAFFGRLPGGGPF